MPNPASDAARNPATHDTPNHATPDTTTSTTVTTTTRPGTKDQVETPTTGTPNPTGDRTNQVQNQEQFTNRAGIPMPRGARLHSANGFSGPQASTHAVPFASDRNVF